MIVGLTVPADAWLVVGTVPRRDRTRFTPADLFRGGRLAPSPLRRIVLLVLLGRIQRGLPADADGSLHAPMPALR